VLQEDPGVMMLLVPLVIGGLLGQIGAIAWWLVWGDGSFLWRLAIHWGISLALIVCALIGFALESADAPNNDPFIADEVLRVFCLLPSISLAIQAVHWPPRTHFRWRVESQTNAERGLQSTPLAILDIFAGTTVVALSLALIRLAEFPFWIEAAATAVFVGAASLVVLAAFFCYSLSSYLILVGAILVLNPGIMAGGRLPWEILFSLFLGVAALGITAAAPLIDHAHCRLSAGLVSHIQTALLIG
jgi:hypothetical protein